MKLLITLFFTIIGITVNCQDTPYIFKNSNGDEFVVLSIEQARTLDNFTEYSPILWEKFDCTSVVDSVCKNLVDDKNQRIQEYKEIVRTIHDENLILKESIVIKDEKINLIENRLDIEKKSSDEQITLKDKEIKKHQVTNKVISSISLITITGLLIIIFGG